MAFELDTTLSTGVSGNYWFLGYVEVICSENPFVNASMDLYLNRQAKIDGKSIMERRNTRMSLYDIDASVSYDFRVCIYTALMQRSEWDGATMVYDDPVTNPKCQDASVTTEMETPVAITIGAYDPYNIPFTFSIVDQPANGSVNIEMASVDFGAGSLSSPVFTYTPNPGFAGQDLFTYTATNDNGVVGNTATVTITVPTQIPSASNLSVSTGMNLEVDLPFYATDPNDLAVTYSVSSNASNGSVSQLGDVFTYTPNTDYLGSDSLEYTASNGTYTSVPATVSIAINSRVPVANEYNVSTAINTPVVLVFDATDPFDETLSYTITTSPSYGSVNESNGVCTYTPNQDVSATDSFTYTATNGTYTSEPANIIITIG
jgi:hypothetical protein